MAVNSILTCWNSASCKFGSNFSSIGLTGIRPCRTNTC